jgi:hypothetical protein
MPVPSTLGERFFLGSALGSQLGLCLPQSARTSATPVRPFAVALSTAPSICAISRSISATTPASTVILASMSATRPSAVSPGDRVADVGLDEEAVSPDCIKPHQNCDEGNERRPEWRRSVAIYQCPNIRRSTSGSMRRFLVRLDEWRRNQPDLPTRPAAARLAEQALATTRADEINQPSVR